MFSIGRCAAGTRLEINQMGGAFDDFDREFEDGLKSARDRPSGKGRRQKEHDGIAMGANGVQKQPFTFNPRPYQFPDAAKIPRRAWLDRRKHYMRGVAAASRYALAADNARTSLSENPNSRDRLMNARMRDSAGP
jgi:hypothetical protein